MNQGMVVRAEVDVSGAHLRIWIDSEAGKHVCTAELHLDAKRLTVLYSALEEALLEQQRVEEALFEI